MAFVSSRFLVDNCGSLIKNDATGSQGLALLGGVDLLEEVCPWVS